MANYLRNIIRFSFVMKVATSILLLGLTLAYLCPFVHPSTWWILPFFGLAYPVIMVLVLLTLLYWTIKKSTWAIVVLVVILLGGKLHFRTLAMPFAYGEVSEHADSLRVLSYNVRLFDLFDYESNQFANRDAIFQYVQEASADVVCFQEFYHQDKPTRFPTRDTLFSLLKAPYHHERYSHTLRGRQNFGIAMFSKYPIIMRGDVQFDDPNNEGHNYCIFADIVKGKDTFRIYNVHLQSIKLKQDDYTLFEEEAAVESEMKAKTKVIVNKLRTAYPKRAQQALQVVEHMEQSPYPVVVCGDFNDTPMSYVYNTFYSRYRDAFRYASSGIGVTYAGKVPAGRIDYIFHSPELQSSHFKIQEKVHSDHRAIQCTIWKPKPKDSI